MKNLWKEQPLRKQIDDFVLRIDPRYEGEESCLIRRVGPFAFVPLVSSKIFLTAKIDVEFFRPQSPGDLVKHGGDLDNRMKTLLDALRMPKDGNELPPDDSPGGDETPFFCVLEDDGLITGISIDTTQLLETAGDPAEVLLIIRIRTAATRRDYRNLVLD
ncbi:MAG: hypothetical protein AABZ16_08295 [candidate division NC10 bacterium]